MSISSGRWPSAFFISMGFSQGHVGSARKLSDGVVEVGMGWLAAESGLFDG